MENVKMVVTGDVLTITVNLKEDHGPSASGKTTIIGTSSGNVSVPNNPDIKVGLNVYKKR